MANLKTIGQSRVAKYLLQKLTIQTSKIVALSVVTMILNCLTYPVNDLLHAILEDRSLFPQTDWRRTMMMMAAAAAAGNCSGRGQPVTSIEGDQ